MSDKTKKYLVWAALFGVGYFLGKHNAKPVKHAAHAGGGIPVHERNLG